MENFLEQLIEKAKIQLKIIVLPEGNDIRIIEAAAKVTKEKIANIILLGEKEDIIKKSNDIKVDISKVTIINPKLSEKKEEYSAILYNLRKHKGLTVEQSKKLIEDETYYGVMMVYTGEADGMVSGAVHSTADTLRPALQILKTDKNTKIVSSFFIMNLKDKNYGENGVLLFSDCGLNENPSEEELSEIAISTASSFSSLVQKTPKIAMLSYSSFGSANSLMTQKVKNATLLVKSKKPNLIVDGEIQVDAALIPSVSKLKTPNSLIEGKANILIFPDLNSGNIGYKLTERLGNAKAYGPITQGLSKPVNDLSRGCNYEDIIGAIVITCLQAQNN